MADGGERARVSREHHARGAVVVREGEPGNRAYYIEAGRVRILRHGPAGETTLAVLGPGEVFGEMALVDNRPRSATAVCEADCTLLAVPRHYLDEAMRRADPVLPLLLKVLIRRLRAAWPAGYPPDGQRLPGEAAAGADVESHRRAFADRLNLEHAVVAALDEGRLFLVVQPIVELATARTAGVEALIRLDDPERGVIPPDTFMDLAEERGLAADLGRWMLGRAAEIAKAYGERLDFVSVNLAASQLRHAGLVEDVLHACRQAGLTPAKLKLEVTERSIIEDPEAAAAILAELRAAGCHVAIDDFGTGESSFGHLHSLPFDTLKIDKSFVAEMTRSERSRRIVAAIAHMAADLGMSVVAEGVETQEHLTLLREIGCRWGQGYYFGRPDLPEAVLGGPAASG